MRVNSFARKKISADPLPHPRLRGRAPELRLFAARRGRSQPPRPRRAEAPSAPARVRPPDAIALARTETQDRRARVRLSQDDARLLLAVSRRGLRQLRGRARADAAPRRRDTGAGAAAPAL